ncbi:MAG: hypothetical protein A3F73_06240 [Gallionellales bacterium RIFCSPLOWO2_12_FULL_59_22]|nr:MAG: hypothetical protein A3H99_02320 [Gallionellales bacterium RIFCSPLOWO2_02_FULL_59_110]OGT01890.1 MAG: hypothetical protein A2Z65_10485 [Gallionellales bacterium RIFCSPLOWO2_02_58_13]OGT10650.1 MAG: hypothetical protein A3F73_06240 [Gallionellales bacterium RIFCSPLOWO2_12_FULL_59_22]
MSLWSRNEHRIVLHRDRVVLVSIGREFTRNGVKRHVLDKQVLPCNASGGEMPWDDALKTFEAARLNGEHRQSRATVILSNQFMRYAMIPWNEALSDEREELTFARHSFKEMYGSDADQWELRLNRSGEGMAQIACAVDARLPGALRGVFGRLGIGLHSIQPHLMTAYNSCRAILRDRSAWLVLVEHDNLCFALLQEGQWCWVRTIRAGAEWREDLPFLLEREALLANAGTTANEVFLWVPDRQNEALPAGSRWRFRYLQPPPAPGLAPERDRRFAMYLNG